MQNHTQSQIIIWSINLICHIIVKGLHTGESPVQSPFFQKTICNSSDKDTENIADSEMYPARCFSRLFGNLFHIISRQLNSRFFPCLTIFDSRHCQLHSLFLLHYFTYIQYLCLYLNCKSSIYISKSLVYWQLHQCLFSIFVDFYHLPVLY